MQPLRATDPATVGEFTLLGRLGAGGMGEVYAGVTRTGRPVAVKVIRARVAADPAFRARFVREVAAARTVGGFWTASVVAADPDADEPWLATEYVPGPSLRQAVAGAGPLPVPAVRIVAARLAEALAAIHAAGLVHRDLKPANVLLAPDGPKVIDFGIARAFQTETAGMTAVIGTPSFMAPEQVRGEPLSPASDVFSLGSTLVYALRGRGPFDTGAPEGVVFRVALAGPDLAGVPAELLALVTRCLAGAPADRPGTADLLAELSPVAGAVVTGYGDWCPPPHDPFAPPARPSAPAAAAAAAEPPALLAPTRAMPTVAPGRVDRHLEPAEQPGGQWRRHPARLLAPLAAGLGASLLLGLLAGFAAVYLDAAWFATIPVAAWLVVAGWVAWRVAEWRRDRRPGAVSRADPGRAGRAGAGRWRSGSARRR